MMGGLNLTMWALPVAAMMPCMTSQAGQPEQTVQKKVAFHVIGLMKTKSGAI
jgi:hypothetical protein